MLLQKDNLIHTKKKLLTLHMWNIKRGFNVSHEKLGIIDHQQTQN